MGQDIKREVDTDDNSETMENAEELLDKANSFVDKLGKVASDANMVIEKKQNMDEADDAKKKSKPSQASNNEETDTMDEDEKIDQFIDGMKKLKDHKGDVKLSEGIDFVESNRNLIKKRL